MGGIKLSPKKTPTFIFKYLLLAYVKYYLYICSMKNAKELNNIVKMLNSDDEETRKMGQGVFETLNEEERTLIELHYANSIIKDRQRDVYMSDEDVMREFSMQAHYAAIQDPTRTTNLILR